MNAGRMQHSPIIVLGEIAPSNGVQATLNPVSPVYLLPSVAPAGFVEERADLPAGVTVTGPARVSHGEFHSVSVVFYGSALVPNYELEVQELLAHEGVNGADGGFLNPTWGPLKLVATAATAAVGTYTLNLDVTEAIRFQITNNGAPVVAAPVGVGEPNGVGVQIRVHLWS